jgi:hypothetical protein
MLKKGWRECRPFFVSGCRNSNRVTRDGVAARPYTEILKKDDRSHYSACRNVTISRIDW